MGRCGAYGKGIRKLAGAHAEMKAQAECAPVYTQQGGWTNSNIESPRNFRRWPAVGRVRYDA